MTAWTAALWGLLGAGLGEALNLYAQMQPVLGMRRWRWPWERKSQRLILAAAVTLRLFVGCGLSAALGASDQLPTPLAATLAGLTAPMVIARFFQAITAAPASVLTDTVQPAKSPDPAESLSEDMDGDRGQEREASEDDTDVTP